jgi:hypothetical protein
MQLELAYNLYIFLSIKLVNSSLLLIGMFKSLYQLINLYKLDKIKEAFDSFKLPVPIMPGAPISSSYSKVGQGSVTLSIHNSFISDPVVEIKLLKDVASIKFLVEALFISLDEPVKDDLVILMHKNLDLELDNGILRTTRLSAGNLACYYNTALPYSKLNYKAVKLVMDEAQARLRSDRAVDIFNQYNMECEHLLDIAMQNEVGDGVD